MPKTLPYASKLAKFKSLWKKAQEKKPEFGGDLPDGRYRARIVRCEVGESQSSGRLQVAWKAIVVDGESKGENIAWYNGLATEDNLMYLQRDIARLGEEVPEDIGELESALAKVASKKPVAILTLVTKGEFQNVRLGKLLSDEEVGELEEETPAAEAAPAEVEAEPEPEPEAEPEPEPEPEAEPEAAAEDDSVEVGMRVAFDLAGKEAVGEVTKINEADETVVVKLDTGKSYKVKAEKLRPAPKTKVKKK